MTRPEDTPGCPVGNAAAEAPAPLAATPSPSFPQYERKKILAGCYLILKENVNGKTARSKNPYWEVMRFRGSILEAEIAGVFGGRTIKMAPKGNSSMGSWLFWGYCPWQGYSIWWSGPNGSLALKEKVVVAVE